ncbi:hypothetical protein GCM10028818_00340 [Spirosoma horti]
MKNLSNLVLGLPAHDHMQFEKTPANRPSQPPDVAPASIHSRQDFAQLLARYKRAGYEAAEQLTQVRHVGG